MATKSRLGKGLGALFPSLPGEPQHQEHAAPAAAAKEVKASKTDEHVESKSASATAQASVNAVQGMKHAVSRETTAPFLIPVSRRSAAAMSDVLSRR